MIFPGTIQKKRRRKGKGIRSEKRQGHSRFPAGQKHVATVEKRQIECPPETTADIDQWKKDIEEKEGQGTI